MKCNKCGNEVSSEDAYCKNCGNLLKKEEPIDNEHQKKENQNLKRIVKIKTIIEYTVFMGISGIILSIICRYSSLVNYLSITFVIMGIVGGYIKSVYIVGICPHCNREIEVPAEKVTNAGTNSSFTCPLCDKKIIL